MSEHPEHDKLAAVKPEAQACGNFLNWLEEQGYVLCRPRTDGEEGYYRAGFTLERLLAQHFEIDLDKIEEEKRAMLRTLNPAFT